MSNSKLRILIVDDEPQITRVLRAGLVSRGYETEVATDGEGALDIFMDWHPEMIVTDLAMPVMNGLELCKRIRVMSNVPIIILSVRGEEKTKVLALEAGADDYVTKPFGIDELIARIRAIQRRIGNTVASENEKLLNIGDFFVDLNTRVVKVRGEELHLTPKEYDLLVYFLRNPEKVLTQRKILGAVWGGDYTEQSEYLRVFVGQLRKKIEIDPSEPRYIITEPWIGYRFNAS